MFIFTPNSNLEKIAQSLWKGALWLQTLEKMNGAWVRNILAESAAQHANPDIGALTNAGQMVLAMVPIIALAIFGASRSTSEYEVTGAQGDFAAFASLGAMQVSRRSRTPWAFMRIHNYYTTGHCWQTTTTGTLKAQRLFLTRFDGPSTCAWCHQWSGSQGQQLWRVVPQGIANPVCVRVGMQWMGSKIHAEHLLRSLSDARWISKPSIVGTCPFW